MSTTREIVQKRLIDKIKPTKVIGLKNIAAWYILNYFFTEKLLFHYY